ncbi:MAG: TonB-dependent receptor plug domain-containing protein [bacterium]
MYLNKILALFLFFLNICLFGQNKVVIIADNNTRIGIPNVFVIGKYTNCISNNAGLVELDVNSINDSILISHVAYEKLLIDNNRLFKLDTVFLKPVDIVTDEVKITSNFIDNQSKVQKLEINEFKKSTYQTIGDLLKNESALYIKDYGGYTGVKAASLRGLGSENTIVLFNEARVNDLRTGMFDFSLISPLSLSKIEVYKNSDFESSEITAGGIVKLYTDVLSTKEKASAGIKLSSEFMRSFFGSYQNNYKNLSFAVNYERAYSSNNYKYVFEGENYRRKNAFFSKSFVSTNINWNLNKYVVKFYSHYSVLTNGVPGFVVTNNVQSSNAINNSKVFLAVLNNKYSINNNYSITTLFSYNTQNLIINDPQNQIFSNKNIQKSKLNDLSGFLKLKYIKENLNLTAGYEYKYSDLKNDLPIEGKTTLELNKNSNKFFGSFNYNVKQPIIYLNNVILSGTCFYEFGNEKIFENNYNTNFSYRFAMGIIPSFINNLILTFNYSDLLRIPTFNEQFYSNLYNAKVLQKEKYKSWDINLDYSFNLWGKTSISFSYYDLISRDKIVWVPSRQALQVPKNYAHIRYNGFEFGLNSAFFEVFDLVVIYNFTQAFNKALLYKGDNSYNKQLVYTPKQRLNINISAAYKNYSFSVYNSFIGDRYYTADNDPYNLLQQYYICDIAASVNYNLFNLKNSVTIAISNLFNNEYFVIQSYPMPLRTLTLTYILELL